MVRSFTVDHETLGNGQILYGWHETLADGQIFYGRPWNHSRWSDSLWSAMEP